MRSVGLLAVGLMLVACGSALPSGSDGSATIQEAGEVTDGSGDTLPRREAAVTGACTSIGCVDSLFFESESLIPGDLYTIEVCAKDRCSTTTVAVTVLDPAFATDTTEVDPERMSGPYLSIGLGLLGVDGDTELAMNIEHVATGSLSFAQSGLVRFDARYPNGVDCPPPCWTASITF